MRYRNTTYFKHTYNRGNGNRNITAKKLLAILREILLSIQSLSQMRVSDELIQKVALLSLALRDDFKEYEKINDEAITAYIEGIVFAIESTDYLKESFLSVKKKLGWVHVSEELKNQDYVLYFIQEELVSALSYRHCLDLFSR